MKDTDYGDFNRSDGGTFIKQNGAIVAHLPPTAPAPVGPAIAAPEPAPAAADSLPVAGDSAAQTPAAGEEDTTTNQPAPRRRRNRQE